MDFSTFLHQGPAGAWLFLPAALLLGALHGLEPGHSKTMMAAFIIAVRGTVTQAALLGLAAAISHSLVIWTLAGLVLHYGSQWSVEAVEPYLQAGTGALVMGLALWTLWRIRRNRHAHGHSHAHGETKVLPGKNGDLLLALHEAETAHFHVTVPPAIAASAVVVTVRRTDGPEEIHSLEGRGADWVSTTAIPEPHEFQVEVAVKSPAGHEFFTTEFREEAAHDPEEPEEEDAHAREHAEDIRRRFAGRRVTTPQIVLFGLTGGLMPCPSALSVLLICLQMKRFALGFSLVAAFSLGLALTLVAVGVTAAWGAGRFLQGSGGRFGVLARRAPYFSSGMLVILGLVLFVRGLTHLP